MSRPAGASAAGPLQAAAFLTVFGGARTPSPAAADWFGPVGAVVGAALGGLWWLTYQAWPAAVAAVIVVGADLAVTGLLHVDGLADTADGLLPPMPRARRLEVMSDPPVGAFGAAAVGVVLIARVVALAGIRPSIALLAALWCVSRAAMAATTRLVPYARATGVASAFVAAGPGESRSRRRTSRPGIVTVLAVAVSLALGAAWRPLAGVVSVAAASMTAALVVAAARRRLGGFTGDVLGAAGVLAETVGLLVAAARW